MRFHYNDPRHKEFRRQLRDKSTDEEQRLWYELKERKMGVKFRRQHGVGPYILDFYCPELKLAIEVDGPYHDFGHQPEYDRERDTFLEATGIATLRFTNHQIQKNFVGCLRAIESNIVK